MFGSVFLLISSRFDWRLHGRIYGCCIFSSHSYLLNPFTILSCVAKSTCALNNAVLALFFLSTIKGQVQFQSLAPSDMHSKTCECEDEASLDSGFVCRKCAAECHFSGLGHVSVHLPPQPVCSSAALFYAGTGDFPLLLIISSLLIFLCVCLCGFSPQRQYIPVNYRRASFWWFLTQYAFIYLGSLFVIICLSFFLLGSWDYLQSVYGFM